jgi:DNA-binding beta-propeller fold protein YncE
MKERKEILEQRKEDAKPKVCEDKDKDGVRAGNGCPKEEVIDCNDNDETMAPGRTEVCDAVDNNCDGMINEGKKGCVQTLFGGATWGTQKEHRLTNPHSVVYDPAGFVIVTDNHHVWKIGLDGQAEILAGSKLSNFADGTGQQARFSYPEGIVSAGGGSYYLADCKNNCLRLLTGSGEATTVAGFCSNLTKHSGQFADGDKDSARFYCPADIAVGKDGNMIVVDRENARIRKVTPSGNVTTIAGIGPMELKEGEGQDGFLDGPGNEARFNDPQSVLIDPKGNIYVSESYNCRIRKIAMSRGDKPAKVTTFVGNSDTLKGVGGYVDGPRNRAKFSYPHGMIFDRKGNIIIADTGNGVIRRVSRTGKVRTIYGQPGKDQALDGPIKQALFKTPTDIALGPKGSLFVADTAANRLRWIVP